MSTKLHRNPPFRAEHLGSLLRTDKLLEVRHANEAGKAQDSDLRAVEDTDVKDIVQTQLDLGYHAITDGEYRRHSMPPICHILALYGPHTRGLTMTSVLGFLLARP